MPADEIDVPFITVDPLPTFKMRIDGNDATVLLDTGADTVDVAPGFASRLHLPTTVAGQGVFAGGRSAQIAEINLHVAANNYGVVEDVHQSLMHILAQYVRMSELPSELVHRLAF